MNQKSNALVTIDLKLHYQFNLFKALKWLLPLIIAVVRLLLRFHFAGP